MDNRRSEVFTLLSARASNHRRTNFRLIKRTAQMSLWFVEGFQGALPIEEVRRLLNEEKIDGSTIAWTQHFPGWLRLEDCPQFGSARRFWIIDENGVIQGPRSGRELSDLCLEGICHGQTELLVESSMLLSSRFFQLRAVL